MQQYDSLCIPEFNEKDLLDELIEDILDNKFNVNLNTSEYLDYLKM